MRGWVLIGGVPIMGGVINLEGGVRNIGEGEVKIPPPPPGEWGCKDVMGGN